MAAKAYKVYYARNGDDPEYYLMDHSTFTYLMAPEVGFLEFYPLGATPEAVAEFGGLLCRPSLTAAQRPTRAVRAPATRGGHRR